MRGKPDEVTRDIPKWILLAAILFSGAGSLGGSLQPSRLLVLAGITYVIGVQRQFAVDRPMRVPYASLALLALVALLSVLVAADRLDAVGLVLTVWIGVAASFLVDAPHTLGLVRSIRRSWVCVLLLTLLVAAVEIVTGTHLPGTVEGRSVGGGAGLLPFAAVTFSNYNNYSAYLALGLPFAIGEALDAESRGSWRIVALLVVVLTAAIVLINTSRAAVLYVASALVISSILAFKRAVVPLLATVGASVVAAYFSGALGVVLLRFGGDLFYGTSTGERVQLIAASIDALKSSFGVGIGPDSFSGYIAERYPHLIPNPHNLLLEIAVSFGVLGLALYCCTLVWLLFVAMRSRRAPLSARLPVMLSVPFVPLVGTINSMSLGYTFWWLWVASALIIASAVHREHLAAEKATRRGAVLAEAVTQ